MIITLCGSTRFKSGYESCNMMLSFLGNIVFSVGMCQHSLGLEISPEEKHMFDLIHMRKIEMSNGIFVIDAKTPISHDLLGSEKLHAQDDWRYIGPSTQREMMFATRRGLHVWRLSKILSDGMFPASLINSWFWNADLASMPITGKEALRSLGLRCGLTK